MIWIPTIDYILKLFEDEIFRSPNLIHKGRLRSTLDKVRWGIPFHSEPDIWDRATILYKDIVEIHYFEDGNKRIGLFITVVFLIKNGFDFITSNDDAYEMTMEVAQKSKTYEDIKEWLKKNSQKID
jgi:death-on-curing protein